MIATYGEDVINNPYQELEPNGCVANSTYAGETMLHIALIRRDIGANQPNPNPLLVRVVRARVRLGLGLGFGLGLGLWLGLG